MTARVQALKAREREMKMTPADKPTDRWGQSSGTFMS